MKGGKILRRTKLPESCLGATHPRRIHGRIAGIGRHGDDLGGALVLGMFAAFAVQGYGAVSNALSTLHVFLIYAAVGLLWPDLQRALAGRAAPSGCQWSVVSTPLTYGLAVAWAERHPATTLTVLALLHTCGALPLERFRARLGVGLLLPGFVLTEAFLFLQGMMFWLERSFLPHYYLLLFLASVPLPVGAALLVGAVRPPAGPNATGRPWLG